MSQDTLFKIKSLLMSQKQKLKINENKIDSLLKILLGFKMGDIVYPGLLIRKLNLKMNDVYRILEFIESENLIERNFEIYCAHCNKYTGDIYRTLRDIPEGILCGECDDEIDPMVDTIIVYRVVV